MEELARYHVYSILDYSVEGQGSDEGISEALKETMASVEKAGCSPDIPFAVFKPTALISHSLLDKMANPAGMNSSELAGAEAFRERVRLLCEKAHSLDTPLLIDAEDSWYQAFVDETVEKMMMQFNKEKAIVFNTLQMYRHDRLSYLKTLIEKARKDNFRAGLKFVRGAYMEKERARAEILGYASPIQPDKTSTDRDFNEALRVSLENLDTVSVFCGTHNEESCLYLIRLMDEKNIPRNHPGIWFSQLYGMSDHISFNLANAGYNVAKYIPYGPVKHVMPYLMRRAEENTSVAGQTGRELSLLALEWERRRNLKKTR